MAFVSARDATQNPLDAGKEVRTKDARVAKPFLKWAGGKSQLLKEIEQYYPFANDTTITKYAEPFVGGGSVLFDILNKFSLKEVYISDVNKDLIDTYKTVRDNVNELIGGLELLEKSYLKLGEAERKDYYIQKRAKFNTLKHSEKNHGIEKAALLIFLNKTCFNGLYRVNKKGDFNVPAGIYKNPQICNKENLLVVSKKLKNVQIICGDYKKSVDFIDNKTFVYFDPPYRPLTSTANFTSYSKESFDDKNQLELAFFVQELDNKGVKMVISNSDPKNVDQEDNFFDKIYSRQNIRRVFATRMINRKSDARGKISELLISNFNI